MDSSGVDGPGPCQSRSLSHGTGAGEGDSNGRCTARKSLAFLLTSRAMVPDRTSFQSVRNFPEFAMAIDTVYLIEASTSLRQAQHKLLCGNNNLKETDAGHESRSRHLENVKIQWREDIRMLPRGRLAYALDIVGLC